MENGMTNVITLFQFTKLNRDIILVINQLDAHNLFLQ